MKIIGLDLAVGATGLCRTDGHTYVIKPRGSGDERLTSIRDQIRNEAGSRDGDLVVVMEDVPSRMIGAAGKVIPMVHGAVRAMLLDREIEYALVSPSTLKKFATGKGNADKTAMILAAYKRSGIEFTDDNECDAWWLRAAGLCHYNEGLFSLPAVQRDALSTVVWPARYTGATTGLRAG